MIYERELISYLGQPSIQANRMKRGESVGTFVPLKCPLCQQPLRRALIEIGRKIMQALGTGTVYDICNRGPGQQQ